MNGKSIDRTLLARQAADTLDALEEYARRIGRNQNPTAGAPREWAARMAFLIGEHREAVKQLNGAVRVLCEDKRALASRLNQMTLANQEQD